MSNKKAEARERVKAMREEQARKERARERMMRFGIAGAVLVAVAIIAVAVISTRGDDGDSTASGNSAVPTAATGEYDGIMLGNEDAPVTVEYWMDFLCPACQSFEQNSGPVLKQFIESGDVQLIAHPITFTGGVYSARASNAFACAAEEGMGSEFKTAAYSGDSLPQWTDNQLADFGADLGIEGEYEECVDDGTYSDWATSMTDKAREAGIEGTPTVIINGEVLQEWQSPQALQSAIEAELDGGDGGSGDGEEAGDEGAEDDGADEPGNEEDGDAGADDD
ncbi:thioredoxin domain-containing protein [Phytoactinopolyspora halophila]|nr:thioredoxin domain-containing protein [Phytoactinopolyspora halophila]